MEKEKFKNNKSYSKLSKKSISLQNNKKYYVKKVKVNSKENDFSNIKKRKNHKVFATIMFVLFMLYIFGYFLIFISKSKISVESVKYGTIDVPTTYKGIIIRNEKVFKSPIDGQPFFEYSENERVKKNSLVCTIKKDDKVDIIEKSIEKIDESILEKQKNRSDLSIFKDDIKRIEKDIKNNINIYSNKLVDGEMDALYSMQRSLRTQIEFRNNIWLTENNSSILELNDKKQSYENQLFENRFDIKTDVSGILSYTIDGMEEQLLYDSPENVTKEQTKMNFENTIVTKSKNIKADEPIFKIVESNIWYLTTYIPSEDAALLNVDDRKVIYTNVDEQDVEINVVIKSIEQIDDFAKVIFKSNESLEKIINLRTIEFKIKDNIYEGIKVPNKAIVEKIFLKIPSNYIIDNNGEKGVFKILGDEKKFIPVKISKQDELDSENGLESYSYILQDFDNLKLGDVISSDNVDFQNYTISEIENYKGVYVVNTSVADFKIIDIITQNSEYSIVKPGYLYGLKVYDNIVSDAKNIQESDNIYQKRK